MWLCYYKNIILNKEKNINNIFADIINRKYIQVFTSHEITLSKKFKQNI